MNTETGIPDENETLAATSIPTDKLKITIRDEENIRTMYVNGAPQSAIDMSDPLRFVFEYTKYFSFPFLLTDVNSAFFIGGGGFTGPRIFSTMGVSVDAAEISKDMVSIAVTEFGVEDSQFNVFICDGREFLEHTDKSYDTIILDAFIASKTPVHLTTVEFYETIKDRLNQGGVFLINIISAPGAWLCTSSIKTLSEVFRTVYAFDVDPESTQTRNIILAATDGDRLGVDELVLRDGMNGTKIEAQLRRLLEMPDLSQATILRDADVERQP